MQLTSIDNCFCFGKPYRPLGKKFLRLSSCCKEMRAIAPEMLLNLSKQWVYIVYKTVAWISDKLEEFAFRTQSKSFWRQRAWAQITQKYEKTPHLYKTVMQLTSIEAVWEWLIKLSLSSSWFRCWLQTGLIVLLLCWIAPESFETVSMHSCKCSMNFRQARRNLLSERSQNPFDGNEHACK